MKKNIVIVSPALADANNGNWQTARRWQKLLQSSDPRGVHVRIVSQWPDGPDSVHDHCMLALHARRSAASIAAWAQRSGTPAGPGATPVAGLAVVLTGTDLYRDIQSDPQAQQSLQLAQRLVVLQELGLQSLPAALQERAVIIFQSTSERQTLPKAVTPARPFRALMVGHLREEKSPQTLFAAARLLHPTESILINHIGAALEPDLATQAQATADLCPHYCWLGALAHEATRRRIQRAHVLIHTSKMEGGAHVVMEAVRSGTPVLASRIAGNVGMLGADYAGYFDWDQADQLVGLLRRCRDSLVPRLTLSPGAPPPDSQPTVYTQLQAQCAARAPLFSADSEGRALHNLVADLLRDATGGA